MQRLANFDVSRQFLTRRGQVAAQLTFGAVCGVTMIGLRAMVDLWAPGAGPFALIYPTVLLATLYGHLRAGLVAFAMSFAWAWYMVVPLSYSLTFENPADGPRVALNAICALVLIVFAEAFRRAGHSTVEQIRAAADRRLTLLADLEHRTKNNFALVASLLEIQKRRLKAELHGPLDDAVARVRTFADAYSSLASEQDEGSEVAMKPYLDHLLDRIERAALAPGVKLFREIEEANLPREVGVAIGLYLNEALSNCAKYAFPGGAPGTIVVCFHVTGSDWRLTVEDDGAGKGAASDPIGGLGGSLMAAFAAQAGASHTSAPLDRGYRSELRTQVAERA